MQCDSSDVEHNEANIIVNPLRTYSDIKICYSTVSGYASHRDDITGSWYIETMSKIFHKFSHNTHLDNLLKLISKDMKDCVGENNEMQTPCNEDIGFSEKLYFNPGYYESQVVITVIEILALHHSVHLLHSIHPLGIEIKTLTKY